MTPEWWVLRVNPWALEHLSPVLLEKIGLAWQVLYDDSIPPELLLWSSPDVKPLPLEKAEPDAFASPGPWSGRIGGVILTSLPHHDERIAAWIYALEKTTRVNFWNEFRSNPNTHGVHLEISASEKRVFRGWAAWMVRSLPRGHMVCHGRVAPWAAKCLKVSGQSLHYSQIRRHKVVDGDLNKTRRLSSKADTTVFYWPREERAHIGVRGLNPPVVITRPFPEAWNFAERLWAAGIDAVPCPIITFAPGRAAPLRVVENPETYHWILFTSPRGVDFFFHWMEVHQRSVSSFSLARFAAIGPATAERLRAWGIHEVHIHPETYQAEGLLELLSPESLKGRRVLIPRATGRPILVDTLRSRGAHVDEWEIYSTRPYPSSRLRLIFRRVKQARWVVFTSPSTFHHFDKALTKYLGARLAKSWWSQAYIFVIGPITAEAVRRTGLPITGCAEKATEEDLAKSVIDHVQKNRSNEKMAP